MEETAAVVEDGQRGLKLDKTLTDPTMSRIKPPRECSLPRHRRVSDSIDKRKLSEEMSSSLRGVVPKLWGFEDSCSI